MEKTGKPVTIIFEKAQSGANGLFYIFHISFDNGDGGKFFSKTELQDVFTLGIEAPYTVETKQSGNYTNTIIKPVRTAKQGFPGRVRDPAQENRRLALQFAVELAAAGRIEIAKISDYAASFLKYLTGTT